MRVKGMGEKEAALVVAAALVGRMHIIDMNPFAVGFFMAICHEKIPRLFYVAALLVGIWSGYGPVDTVRYGVVLLLSCCICFFMERKAERVPLLVYSGIGSVVLFGVQYVWLKQSILYSYNITLILLESLLAGIFTQVLYMGIHALLTEKKAVYVGNEEMISIMVLGSLMIFGMPMQENPNFGVLDMLLALFVLFTGYKFGAGAGSMAGAIGGLFFLVQENGFSMIGILAVLGIGAGLFRELGKGISSVTFLMLYIAFGRYFDTTLWDAGRLRGVVAAIALFLCLPKKLTNRVESSVLEKDFALNGAEQMEKQVKKKLEHFAEPFFKLSKTFSKLSEKKLEMEERDVERVLQEVTDNLCVYCEKSNRCLGYTRHKKYQTAACILGAVKEHGYIEEEDFPVHFVNKCDYLSNYVDVTNQALKFFHNNLEWQNKLAESREAIAEQFEEIGLLLQDFSKDRYMEQEIEVQQKKDLVAILKRNQVLLRKIEKVEKNNHFVELHLVVKSRKRVCVTTKELANIVSSVLGKNYVPSSECKNVLAKEYEKIVLVKDTKFKALTGMAQRNKAGELVSGDNYSFIRLDSGELVMTLADGMGSGESACLESTSVVELLESFLEAGVGERTAIRLINSIFLLKSEEQQFSTLDMAILNLYTGVCDFIKMGAATAFIKRDKWVEMISSTTLPIGMFNQVDYDNVSKKLYDGDYIIILSDGILDTAPCVEKEVYFQELLLGMDMKNPDELANAILEHAMGINHGEIVDDMTVLVTGMWKKCS